MGKWLLTLTTRPRDAGDSTEERLPPLLLALPPARNAARVGSKFLATSAARLHVLHMENISKQVFCSNMVQEQPPRMPLEASSRAEA